MDPCLSLVDTKLRIRTERQTLNWYPGLNF